MRDPDEIKALEKHRGKLSISIQFRNAVSKLTTGEFRQYMRKHHRNDICFENPYNGILSFDDFSWAEWMEYDDKLISVWAYHKWTGSPVKTNPKSTRNDQKCRDCCRQFANGLPFCTNCPATQQSGTE